MVVLTAVVAVLISIIFLYCVYSKWKHQYWTRKGVTQLKPIMIFGDTLPLATGKIALRDYYFDIYKKYKPTGVKAVGIYNAHVPELIPLDVDLLKDILVKEYSYFSSHGTFYNDQNVLTSHLFNLEGQVWKERRTKLTPLFSSGKIKGMLDTVTDISVGLVALVGQSADANQPANMKEIFSRFTTDVIASAAFGLDCKSLNEPDNMLRSIGKEIFIPSAIKLYIENLFPRKFLGYIGYQTLSKRIVSYFSKMVKDTIDYRENNEVQRKDFMQLMLQLKKHGSLLLEDGSIDLKNTGDYITNKEILSESFLTFIAGHETTASTMTFALFALASEPEIQRKLRTEINEVLAKHEGKLTHESLMEMEYLDQVVRETLRKYPVVPDLTRRCMKDFKIKDTNIIIEKGTKIHIPVVGIQLDSEFYPDPERFNPENFSRENRAKRPDVAWLPFGVGPRTCIGMRLGLAESKVGIVALLPKFRFTLNKTMKPPYKADAGTIVYTFKQDVLLDVERIS